MKKILTVLVVLVLLSSTAFAARFGKPGANLEKGQWSLGVEYNYIEAELDLQVPESFILILPPDRFQLGEEQAVFNQVLVRAGYGLLDTLEVFLKMGGTATDVSDVMLDGAANFNRDLEGSMEFTIAGGLACTIIEEGNFRLGAVGSLTYFDTDDTCEGPFPDLIQAIDANVFILEGALMASYQIDKLTPYAGVVMHVLDADAQYRMYTRFGGPIATVDVDVDQEDWLGLVFGASYEVAENVNVDVEITHVSEGAGVSIGVNCAL